MILLLKIHNKGNFVPKIKDKEQFITTLASRTGMSKKAFGNVAFNMAGRCMIQFDSTDSDYSIVLENMKNITTAIYKMQYS